MARTRLILECGSLREPDLGTIDRIARLRLDLRRRDVEVLLRHPSTELMELIHLAGLAGVLRAEPLRQPEEREERPRVEEERELDDPPA